MPEAPITTTGTLHDAMHGRAWEAELPNGKRLVAHLPRRLQDLAPSLLPGTRVLLEMTPYDFDKARIAGLADHA
ncbi:MAG: translation initiation factor IF-1 [Akkermansiaceae bacterium]|nr:translation initiation factor IF-1 [Akkermansiaceae bacterium]